MTATSLASLVLTAQGHPIRFDSPAEQVVDDDDLFASLQRRYRWSAMMDWTVLQHSVLVLRLVQRLYPGYKASAAYGAMHDMLEAYTGDFPGPGKKFLPGLAAMEEGFTAAVHAHFLWPEPSEEDHARVKDADLQALVTEAYYFDMHYEVVSEQVGKEAIIKDVHTIYDIGCTSNRDLWYELMSSIGVPARPKAVPRRGT